MRYFQYGIALNLPTVRCHYTGRHLSYIVTLESGQCAGYTDDVWFPRSAPGGRLWCTMPHRGMTPHISANSVSAQ